MTRKDRGPCHGGSPQVIKVLTKGPLSTCTQKPGEPGGHSTGVKIRGQICRILSYISYITWQDWVAFQGCSMILLWHLGGMYPPPNGLRTPLGSTS